MTEAREDIHSFSQIAFLLALYYEARGFDSMAVPFLRSIIEGVTPSSPLGDYDCYMKELARCHLRILKRRLVVRSCLGGSQQTYERRKEGAFCLSSKSEFLTWKGCVAVAHGDCRTVDQGW